MRNFESLSDKIWRKIICPILITIITILKDKGQGVEVHASFDLQQNFNNLQIWYSIVPYLLTATIELLVLRLNFINYTSILFSSFFLFFKQDPRFNQEIDQKTGYRTRSILCMPITDHYHGEVWANKVNNSSLAHWRHLSSIGQW